MVSVTAGRGVRLSVRPPGRPAVFFGGQMRLGAIATIIIRAIASMTRRSTYRFPRRLGVSAPLLLRDRVVTARVKRMAPQDATDAQPRAFERTVPLNGLVRIARTRRHEA